MGILPKNRCLRKKISDLFLTKVNFFSKNQEKQSFEQKGRIEGTFLPSGERPFKILYFWTRYGQHKGSSYLCDLLETF